MVLHEGDSLGRYRIVEEVGAGGMGVVYRAFDERLGRDVAIKVVSDKAAEKPDVVSRFRREAKAVAKLAHPNVVALHDFVEEGATAFAVMEFLDGETLQDRLQRQTLSLEETASIAVGVAKGLAAAHEKGIVHRDLKPANIFLTSDGHPKVVDFGLAHRQALPNDATQSHDDLRTESGSIMGTVGYMSPEQVRGKAADARSDIFSFGAVLYEMVTKERAFQRDTAVETLTAILHQPVPDTGRRDIVLPAPFDRVVQRCLAKDPNNRFQSTVELLESLTSIHAKRQSRLWPMVGAACAAVALTTALFVLRPRPPVTEDDAPTPASLPAVVTQDDAIRRAREETLPLIEHLKNEGESWEALQQAKQVEELLATDPLFNELLESISYETAYDITPAGAHVFVREYHHPNANFEELGITPIEPTRLARTPKVVRVEKEGYVPLEFLARRPNIHLELQGNGEIPSGMALVNRRSPTLLSGIKNPLGPLTQSPYLIDLTEVTNREFKVFVDGGGYAQRELWTEPFISADGRVYEWDEAMRLFVDKTGRPGPATWQVATYPEGQDDYPVRGVSWYEANAYARLVGKQLPTIHHWCGATDLWTNTGDLIQQSNLGTGEFAAVSKYRGVSRAGTFDTAGNVAEWCWNANAGKRFCLGGSALDQAYSFTFPRAEDPFDRSERNGFRCMKYLADDGPTEAELADVPLVKRDYSKEKPASDERFASYKDWFNYDARDLNVEVIYTIDGGRDFTKEKIEIDTHKGERMPIYLYVPKNSTPPYQTLVLFRSALARRTVDSEQDHLVPVGHEYNSVPGRYKFVMQNGLVLVQPVLKGMYERRDGFQTVASKESVEYAAFVIERVKDYRRTIDYLLTREDIDEQKIGYIGLSSGASNGLIIPAVEERLTANICYSGGLPMHRVRPYVDPINFVTRVKVPTLWMTGRFDTFYPYSLSGLPAFELLGTDIKRHRISESGHMVPDIDRVRETLSWLDEQWGPPE